MTNQPEVKLSEELYIGLDGWTRSASEIARPFTDALELQLSEKDAKLATAEILRAKLCAATGEETVINALVAAGRMRAQLAAMRETLIAVLDEAVLQDPFQDDKGQAVLERGRKAAGG